MRLSELHPSLYHIRVAQKRLTRYLYNRWQAQHFATQIRPDNLPFCHNKHQSLLYRKLGNADPQLQKNKVVNLAIAKQNLDGIVIHPGQVFSFWYLVGQPTADKGYLEGLQLSRGKVKTGIGGGLCQLGNLLYWMVLHTPLTVLERHHHSFDPFPDEQRVLPFGSGASLFYNYVDLQFFNPTKQSFQFRIWLTEKHLKGAIYSDRELPHTYHIFERHHHFLEQAGKTYRSNEIWRSHIDKLTGNQICEELLIKNFSEVKYVIDPRSLAVSSANPPSANSESTGESR